jgi:hypothetical protein
MKLSVWLKQQGIAEKPGLKNQRRIVEEFCAAKKLAPVEFVEKGGRVSFQPQEISCSP